MSRKANLRQLAKLNNITLPRKMNMRQDYNTSTATESFTIRRAFAGSSTYKMVANHTGNAIRQGSLEDLRAYALRHDFNFTVDEN